MYPVVMVHFSEKLADSEGVLAQILQDVDGPVDAKYLVEAMWHRR